MIDAFVKIGRGICFGLIAVVIAAWIQWDGTSIARRIDHQVAEVKVSVPYRQLLAWSERSFYEVKDKVSHWLGITPLKQVHRHSLSTDGISSEEQAELRNLMQEVSQANR